MFDSESAKIAARKSHKSRRVRITIAQAIKKRLGHMIDDPENPGKMITMAEYVAYCMIRDSTSGTVKTGNVGMLKMLLELAGETEKTQITANINTPLMAIDLRGFTDEQLEELLKQEKEGE